MTETTEENYSDGYTVNVNCTCDSEGQIIDFHEDYLTQQNIEKEQYEIIVQKYDKMLEMGEILTEYQRYQTGFQFFFVVTILIVAIYRFFKMFF